MIQSTSQFPGLHVAIIMDGNGRWATTRNRPRSYGHRAGADAVRRVITAAGDCGIGILTLYAFSQDNWQRPSTEVLPLLRLFRRYLLVEAGHCAAQGVRLNVIGRRDRLGAPLLAAVHHAEQVTRDAGRMLVRLAVDYSSRDAILRAAAQGRYRHAEDLAAGLARAQHGLLVPDVDLLIRTGRERRLSDFMLWESAYAELYFSDVFWPDFDQSHLELALEDFRARTRRFGRLPLEHTA